MQFTTSLLALAALSISVLAGPHHRHFHQKKAPMPDVFEALAGAPAKSSSVAPASTPAASTPAAATTASSSSSSSGSGAGASLDKALSVLSGLGIKTPQNSNSNNGQIWLGSDGPYTNKLVNAASETITVVVWGSQGSWVNAVAPWIAVTLPPGASQTISIANGVSGALSAIYSGTQMVNGQISNTWGEFTMNGQWTTFDVSREVNMGGKTLKMQGDNCYSDMSTCVFVCTNGASSCWTDYTLQNCAAGSQAGAGAGTYGGAASGGCTGDNKSLTTTFS